MKSTLTALVAATLAALTGTQAKAANTEEIQAYTPPPHRSMVMPSDAARYQLANAGDSYAAWFDQVMLEQLYRLTPTFWMHQELGRYKAEFDALPDAFKEEMDRKMMETFDEFATSDFNKVTKEQHQWMLLKLRLAAAELEQAL